MFLQASVYSKTYLIEYQRVHLINVSHEILIINQWLNGDAQIWIELYLPPLPAPNQKYKTKLTKRETKKDRTVIPHLCKYRPNLVQKASTSLMRAKESHQKIICNLTIIYFSYQKKQKNGFLHTTKEAHITQANQSFTLKESTQA